MVGDQLPTGEGIAPNPYAWLYRRENGGTLIRTAGHARSLADAKREIELSGIQYGVERITATVKGPRGQWAFQPHKTVRGRMVWKSIAEA